MKILGWDIETAPMTAAVWGLYDQTINHESIIKDWYIISAAWKWFEGGTDSDVHSVAVGREYDNDYNVVKRLHGILSKADVIVAQNGDAFDLKKFNARAIEHSFTPLPPIASVDTLKVARRHFKFSSNRLDYLCKRLLGEGKMETPKGLWMDCIRGDRKAIQIMRKYNEVDVLQLERLYNKLKPYMQNHPNKNLFGEGHVCPNCGSKHIVRNGYKITRVGRYQRFQCSDCGAYSVGGSVHKPVLIR